MDTATSSSFGPPAVASVGQSHAHSVLISDFGTDIATDAPFDPSSTAGLNLPGQRPLPPSGKAVMTSLQDVPRGLPRPIRYPADERLLETMVVSPKLNDRTVETICSLPAQITFTGDANYDSDVRIAGSVVGTVSSKETHTISVAEGGSVKGTLRAAHLFIQGATEGEHIAQGGLANFTATAVSKGTVTYSRLRIQEGADVEASMRKIAA